ncbi:MAG: tail protein X [Cyanobacteria bacterium P01_C01_bin.121]
MTTFRTYQTKEGDRWDLIAFAEYGDPYGYERIISANPSHVGALELPGGISLRIPVVSVTPTISKEDLPPWKR